jgi:hypothetical protein
MTDFTDDELVSAVLDGEATDEETARVYADVVLSARLDELRAARDTIAASVALPTSEQRDALIATAVASAEAPAETATAASPAIDMHNRRRRTVLRVASIAAALLAVAGLVGAIAAISGRDSRKANSTAAGQTSSSAVLVPAEGQPGPASSLDTSSAAAAAGDLAELGSFQTPQELVDAVKTQMPPAPQALQATHAASAITSSTGVPCGSRNNVTYTARASLSGQPVIVIVTTSAGQQTIEVVDLNCTVVFTRPL